MENQKPQSKRMRLADYPVKENAPTAQDPQAVVQDATLRDYYQHLADINSLKAKTINRVLENVKKDAEKSLYESVQSVPLEVADKVRAYLTDSKNNLTVTELGRDARNATLTISWALPSETVVN